MSVLMLRLPVVKGRLVTPADASRFWSHVDRSDPSGCWLWTVGTDQYGYGQKRAELHWPHH